VFQALEVSLRSGLSQTLLGQKTPKQALDETADDWRRIMRRAANLR